MSTNIDVKIEDKKRAERYELYINGWAYIPPQDFSFL
jgi:hypothetical protein